MVDYLNQLKVALENAPRFGGEEDVPEGVRYIQLSDTLAIDVTCRLGEIIEQLQSNN